MLIQLQIISSNATNPPFSDFKRLLYQHYNDCLLTLAQIGGDDLKKTFEQAKSFDLIPDTGASLKTAIITYTKWKKNTLKKTSNLTYRKLSSDEEDQVQEKFKTDLAAMDEWAVHWVNFVCFMFFF